MQTFSPINAELFLKRWTVDDYHQMILAGILTPADRVELLDGQIVEMAPQDPPHASRINDQMASLLLPDIAVDLRQLVL